MKIPSGGYKRGQMVIYIGGDTLFATNINDDYIPILKESDRETERKAFLEKKNMQGRKVKKGKS